MVFAELVAEVVEELRGKGIDKPVVASLVGDVQVEQASEYLYEPGIVAYPYTTELPVAVLGAKYQWARNAGLGRSEEHTSEIQSLMRISYAVFCLKNETTVKPE